jgi:hypothetical protein
VLDLAPTSSDPQYGSAIYSVMVDPNTLYNGDPTGNHTVYVIEVYNAYGVSCSSCCEFILWLTPLRAIAPSTC